MASLYSDPLYSLLADLASLPGPSFHLFASQFSDIGLSAPSPTAQDFANKIYASNCKSVGNDANANLRALGYIIYSFVFQNKGIDEELMEIYFEDLLADGEGLNQIQNCPYLEELTKDNRRKLVATMLLDLVEVVQKGRGEDLCQKLKIISEIFGVCARASLIKEGKQHQERNYGMRLFSDYIFPKILQRLNIQYHHKPLIYFFPQKHLFIAFPDQRQYICGTYAESQIQFTDSSTGKEYISSPNPQTIPFQNFKLNIGDQFDLQSNIIGGTPYFNDEQPTPKFQMKPNEIQKLKINPIIEEELEDFADGNLGAIKNSQISRFMDKSSISEFHPHECESNGEDSGSEEKIIEIETVKILPQYRVKSDEEVKKSTEEFQVNKSTERKERSRNVVKVEKNGKTSYSGHGDRSQLQSKKMIYSCTDQQTKVRIPAFLENKKKKNHNISLISNVYHYSIHQVAESHEEVPKKTHGKTTSTDNFLNDTRLSQSKKKKSHIPEFLLKRGKKKNKEEDLQKFKSQKLLKPKIHFIYRNPVNNEKSVRYTHRHTKSMSTKQMLIFPY